MAQYVQTTPVRRRLIINGHGGNRTFSLRVGVALSDITRPAEKVCWGIIASHAGHEPPIDLSRWRIGPPSCAHRGSLPAALYDLADQIAEGIH